MVEDVTEADELQKLFEHMVERNEFYTWLDVEPVHVERGRVVGELPFDEKLTPPSPPALPGIHGGILSTLVDLSSIAAMYTVVDDLQGVATTDMSVSFHDSVQETVRAEAEVVDVGDTLGTARVSVQTVDEEEPQPVASGQVTCRIFD